MGKPMRLQTYNPEEARKRREHEREGDVEFILNCWSCRRDFSVWIGLGNMNCTLFKCTHCKETNEIE